ncbi:MAG TPA: sulfite exporter TauE/SafE family protein [Gemmatirosa sp.]
MLAPDTLSFLFVAGLVGGALNAAAGGGSFITLPALVYAGLPAVAASASSTVALFPGRVTSAWVYRNDLAGFGGVSLRALLAASLGGGAVGAMLLLHTSAARFDAVVPWLLLAATVTFAAGPRLSAIRRTAAHAPPAILIVGQFLLCAYSGYFGGAVGIMTLALWSLAGVPDVRAMNAVKTVLLGVSNSVSVLCFVAARAVHWPVAGAMLLGAALGGYAGAHLTRRVTAQHLRIGLTVFNVAVTGAFFLKLTR